MQGMSSLKARSASRTHWSTLSRSTPGIEAIGARTFTFGVLWRAALATVRQTSLILFVIFTAKILSVTLIYFQVPATVVSWIGASEMTPMHIFLAIVVVYLILGMFVDGIAMMVITVPFIVPILTNAHMDLVWMGVVICILIEVGLLTPPVGLNLYVLQGVTGESIRDFSAGATPFIVLQLLMIAMLYQWPDIALFMPKLVMGCRMFARLRCAD